MPFSKAVAVNQAASRARGRVFIVLDADAYTGTVQKMHITTDQKLVIETITNIDALAEENKQIRNDESRTSRTGDMKLAARLPMTVYLDLQKRGILYDKAAMRRWLSSDEAMPFRTSWMAS